jgi:hypothetical protein
MQPVDPKYHIKEDVQEDKDGLGSCLDKGPDQTVKQAKGGQGVPF